MDRLWEAVTCHMNERLICKLALSADKTNPCYNDASQLPANAQIDCWVHSAWLHLVNLSARSTAKTYPQVCMVLPEVFKECDLSHT